MTVDDAPRPLSRPVLGVVGGVGPAAGVDLVQKIHAQTSARKDQDHLPVVLASLPGDIPDRTEFLLGRSSSNPAEPVSRILSLLASAGASIIGIPCNTLHARSFFRVLQERARRENVQLIDMIAAVRQFIGWRLPDARVVGVMCTSGTARSRVYSELMAESGIEVVYPDDNVQEECVHRSIYDPAWGIKATSHRVSSEARQRLLHAVAHLAGRKAQCVILGCTELPLAFESPGDCEMPLVDPTAILAREMVRTCDPAKLVPDEANPLVSHFFVQLDSREPLRPEGRTAKM